MTRQAAPCAIPGCPADSAPGRSRCRSHQLDADRRAERKRPTAAQRGYDRKWQRTRDRKLDASPYCTCDGCPSCYRLTPAGRCLRPATDPDHVDDDGMGPYADDGHDLDKLQSLCHPCHSHRTGRDQGPLAR